MNDIKISVTFIIPGRQMYSEQAANSLQEDSNSGYEENIQEYITKNKKKVSIKYLTRKSIPARQSIKMTEEAYYYMTGKDSCPEWERKSNWLRMSKRQRLKSHFDKIKEDLHAYEYSYEIFED